MSPPPTREDLVRLVSVTAEAIEAATQAAATPRAPPDLRARAA
jgi:hypothetical protein